MPYHFALAPDHGVKPAELSEIIAHLAFYAGWGMLWPPLPVAKDISISAVSVNVRYFPLAESFFYSLEGHMKITRVGSTPSMAGLADWFSGNVRVDSLFPPDGGRRSNGGLVTFEPGARTRWHTHPAGQTIIITQGLGWVQREGGPVEEVRPGDVVFFEVGERHWHGASAQVGMVHLAITEVLDGKAVDWLEPVMDEQYGK